MQLNGFSSVWVLSWVFKLLDLVNFFSHFEQLLISMGCCNGLDYSQHWLTVTGLVGLTVLIAILTEEISWVLSHYAISGLLL